MQEEFYVESNVDKALRIDEWTAEALTTSCVDDTFFILHKCGTRCAAARHQGSRALKKGQTGRGEVAVVLTRALAWWWQPP